MPASTEAPGGSERPSTTTEEPFACSDCLRRSWLLAQLSPRLELRGRDLQRLLGLLELPDGELIEAVGARAREDLHAGYARFDPSRVRQRQNVQTVCSHSARDPLKLRARTGARRALHVLGSVERLRALLREPVVVIAGTPYASDYGIQTARSLARGLASTGVTVASGLAAGIPAAAHTGALDVQGPTFTVMAGGVDVCRPASRTALYRRLGQSGCVISELPYGFAPRRWCDPLRARLLVELADMVIIVEAQERPHELALAHIASAAGTTLAAVPGRVTSVASSGTHALLMGGARLVRGPQDALDALYGAGTRQARHVECEIEPGAQRVLEQVGLGCDTLPKLTAAGADAEQTLLALAQLELRGMLLRGDGGRYVPARGAHDG